MICLFVVGYVVVWCMGWVEGVGYIVLYLWFVGELQLFELVDGVVFGLVDVQVDYWLEQVVDY